MRSLRSSLKAAGLALILTAPMIVTATTNPAVSKTFEFRICFDGSHGRCFEARAKPGLIRQYGGRTDSEASASSKSITDLTAEVNSVLTAAETALKNGKPQLKSPCARPLKFQLRNRESVICLEKLEHLEKSTSGKPKALPQILALLDKLSLQSKSVKSTNR